MPKVNGTSYSYTPAGRKAAKAAEAKKEQITEAAKSGINDYCIKPFNREKLNSKIENVFNKL